MKYPELSRDIGISLQPESAEILKSYQKATLVYSNFNPN